MDIEALPRWMRAGLERGPPEEPETQPFDLAYGSGSTYGEFVGDGKGYELTLQ